MGWASAPPTPYHSANSKQRGQGRIIQNSNAVPCPHLDTAPSEPHGRPSLGPQNWGAHMPPWGHRQARDRPFPFQCLGPAPGLVGHEPPPGASAFLRGANVRLPRGGGLGILFSLPRLGARGCRRLAQVTLWAGREVGAAQGPQSAPDSVHLWDPEAPLSEPSRPWRKGAEPVSTPQPRAPTGKPPCSLIRTPGWRPGPR